MKNIWGTPVMTVSKIVKNLMMEQGNNNQNHYVDNLVRATRVFKDLLKETIWSTRYKVIKVDTADNTITMPQDLVRLYNLNVVDKCGNIVPLAHNPDMNTICMDGMSSAKCSCTSCNGDGTYCLALDSVQVVTEEVIINEFPFIKRTWIQKAANGSIQKVIENPYPVLPMTVGVLPEVTYKTEYESLCNLEVTASNCIKKTEANHLQLMRFCGCYIPEWQAKMCNANLNPLSPAMNLTDINPNGVNSQWIRDYYCENSYFPQSNYGYWNWEVNAHEKIHLKMIRADRIIICYQTNGDNCDGEELLIPEYALDAIQFGICYRQLAFNNSASIADKKFNKNEYNSVKADLRRFLAPVNPAVLLQLQSITPKWG